MRKIMWLSQKPDMFESRFIFGNSHKKSSFIWLMFARNDHLNFACPLKKANTICPKMKWVPMVCVKACVLKCVLNPSMKKDGILIVCVLDTWTERYQYSHTSRTKMEDKSLIKTIEKVKFVENVTYVLLLLKVIMFLLVNGLEHNILSISELFDKRTRIIFKPDMWSTQSIKHTKLSSLQIETETFTP